MPHTSHIRAELHRGSAVDGGEEPTLRISQLPRREGMYQHPRPSSTHRDIRAGVNQAIPSLLSTTRIHHVNWQQNPSHSLRDSARGPLQIPRSGLHPHTNLRAVATWILSSLATPAAPSFRFLPKMGGMSNPRLGDLWESLRGFLHNHLLWSYQSLNTHTHVLQVVS